MRESYSSIELGQILCISDRAVRKRATVEGWPFVEVSNPQVGGVLKRYSSDRLPEDVLMAVRRHEAGCLINGLGAAGPTCQLAQTGKETLPAERRHTVDPSLDQKQIREAMAKADLVRLYLKASGKAKWGGTLQVKQDFLTAYNYGAFPVLLEQLGEVSFKTIESWLVKLRAHGNDPFCLVDQRGIGKRGVRAINPAAAEIVIKVALSPNKPSLAEIYRIATRIMHERNVQNGLSYDTYRRFLMDFQKHHYDQWVFYREGEKALNDKCLPYIERDITRLEVGDVLVADGHNLNFEILNPWTGKPKRMALILWYDMRSNYPLGWEIMPTENTQTIAAALRRAILRLGKCPKVAYLDNGRAFRSRFFQGCQDFDQAGFTGLFERLGIQTMFAWPYHGQSKPIERFFGSFGELERLAPSYVGNNIENKPPRLNRGETIHRALYAKVTGGATPTLEQAHRAVASWFDEYSLRPQGKSSHLAGCRPQDIFDAGQGPGVDPAELRYLMMDHQIKHVRRDGISLLGESYYDPELYGRTHAVRIRYDLQARDSILVFDEAGNFLCEAGKTGVCHPAARILGSDDDVAQLEDAIARKRGLQKQTIGPARAFLRDEVLPEVKRQMEAAGFVDGDGASEGRGDRLESLSHKRRGKLLALPMSEEEKARIQAEYDERADINRALQAEVESSGDEESEFVREVLHEPTIWEQLPTMNDVDRYEKLLELRAQGHLIIRDEQAFMAYFEQTEQYQRRADFFEYRRQMYAVVYQTGKC